MKSATRFKLMNAAIILSGGLFVTQAPVLAQEYPAPASYPAQQLDGLVSRIALYPDPLLAQIFAAAAFPDQIAQAAQWAGQYRNLSGDQLANAVAQANLPFDPAVQALIPFPTVLDMMAQDPNWTRALGDAVMNNQGGVMDAVQQLRRSAQQYGYLQSNQQTQVIDNGGEVEIAPVDPNYVYVPMYDPYVVFAQPRPGFYVGGAIRFNTGFYVGGFSRFGWGGGGFNWRSHSVMVDHRVWNHPVRRYDNPTRYSNNYRNMPAYDNRNGNRGSSDRFNNSNSYRNFTGNRPSSVTPPVTAPTAPERNFNRGNFDRGSFNGSRNFTGNRQPSVTPQTPAPAAPERNFNRGNFDRGSFNGSRNFTGNRQPSVTPQVPAPAAPERNFNRGNFDRGSFNGSRNFTGNRQPSVTAPAAPERNFNRGNRDRGSGFTQNAQPSVTPQAPARQQQFNSGRNFERRAPEAAPQQRSATPQPQQQRSFTPQQRNENGGREGHGGRR